MYNLPNARDLILIILFISAFGGIIFQKRFQSYKRVIKMCCFLIAYLVFYWLLTNRAAAFLKIIIMCLSIIIYLYTHKSDVFFGFSFFEKYVKIICFISIISLFFWIMGPYLGIIKQTGISYSTWGRSIGTYKSVPSYFGVYFIVQSNKLFTFLDIVRNSACFVEAPMASFHFSLAFVIDLLLLNDTNKKRRMLLIVAVLSTISVAGYIVTILAIFFKFTISKSNRSFVQKIRIMVIPLSGITALYLVYYFFNLKLGTNSGNIRLDDFRAGFLAWLDSPIFGNGYGNEICYQQYMSAFRSSNLGFSNSFMQILAQGGIWLIVLYLYSFIKGLYLACKRKAWEKLFFIILFFFLFVSTVVSYTGIVILIFFIIREYNFYRN